MVNRMMYQNQGMQQYGSPRGRAQGCGPLDGESHASCQIRQPYHQAEDNDWRRKVPTGSRACLMNYITEESFGVYEALLFLDTHPDCREALQYFREHNEKRNYALKEYARAFGPLTISTADDTACRSWDWIDGPWPWEGGDC